MILYNIRVFADKKEFSYKISEIEVTEGPKAYSGSGKRISKDKIMKIDTLWNEQHRFIHYHTYCLDGQQQQAIDMLKAHVIAKANQYKAEIEAVLAVINQVISKP